MTDKLIGTKPYQVPSNADLGDTAFQDSKNVNITGIGAFTQLSSTEAVIPSTTKPNIEPTLLLDFVNSETVDSRITFTRESIATRTNRFGLIETVDWNTPRIDYDPVTKECKGFLIEEARTNVLLYSNTFSSWTVNGSVTANYTTAPDGTNSAWLFTDASDSGYAVMTSNNVTYTANDVWCASVYVLKDSIPKTDRFCLLRMHMGSSTRLVDMSFDTSTGQYSATATGTATVSGAGIIDCGNWWRVWVSGSNTVTSIISVVLYPAVGHGTDLTSYSPTVTGNFVGWGAQLELGAFPTSYIPTSGTAVTREVDKPTFPVSPFININEGTLYADFSSKSTTNFAVVYFGTESSGTPHIARSTWTGYTTNVFGTIYNNATSTTYAALTFPATAKIAYAYKSGDSAISGNGSLTTNSGTFANVVKDNVTGTIGYNSVTTQVGSLNGYMKKIAYYPKRVSNTELQALTRI